MIFINGISIDGGDVSLPAPPVDVLLDADAALLFLMMDEFGRGTTRTSAFVVETLQTVARTLPQALPAGSGWTAQAGLGTATPATLTMTLGAGVPTPTPGDVPSLSIPHGRNPWQIEVTARLAAFTGGSTTTWTALLVSDASGGIWLLAQARGDGELSIFDSAGFVSAATGAFALDGTDRVRIICTDGVLAVYTGDGTSWRRHLYSDRAGSLGSPSGNYSQVRVRLSEAVGAAGTITAQWADVVVRGL